MKLKKILIVQPKAPTLGWQSAICGYMPFISQKFGMAPISITTIAALTPKDIEIDLWDEYVSGEIDNSYLSRGYDFVALTAFSLHMPRAIEISNTFREGGIPCVIGGPGISSEPNLSKEFFDHIFIGEAEYTWPQFIRDWEAGSPQAMYRQIEKPSLEKSPIPRWELLPNMVDDYIMGQVQTTRGCPFDCDFCDVIYLFGRKPRNKPIENILDEVKLLQKIGMQVVFFSDDNFIGRPKYAKDLLRQLIALNRSFNRPIEFVTQVTLNVARDDELLELLADANFWRLFIGIESSNVENLKASNKLQNYNTDMQKEIEKIHSYGMTIHGSMIVGFDHDGPEVFENTERFFQESAIAVGPINILGAHPGTKLWHRLRKERRILTGEKWKGHMQLGSNVIFMKMSRVEVFQGYIDLLKRLYNLESVEMRIKKMILQVNRKPCLPFKPYKLLWRERKRLLKVFKYFLFTNDKEIKRLFFSSLATTFIHAKPYMLMRVIKLMVLAIAMKIIISKNTEPHFKKLIEEEKQDNSQFLPDDDGIVFPELFQKEYKWLFPTVYRRLSYCINDSKLLNDACVEVFTDFIERWHKEYDVLGKQRFYHLQEICDRTAMRLSGENITEDAKTKVPPICLVNDIIDNEEKIVITKLSNDIKRMRLDEDVYKAIEQGICPAKDPLSSLNN